MIVLLSLVLMIGASFGGGALLLKASGTFERVSYPERLSISMALGVGVIGWSVFFLALAGEVHRHALMALLCVLFLGIYFLKPKEKLNIFFKKPDFRRYSLLAAIVLVLFYDVLEGIAPPTDADSLAYHFALPKSFLSMGGIFPVYRALDGAIPLLQQMTYMAALGIGGEKAMTLWTMSSGWGASALVFVITKRFISTNWALAITLIFLSTPAILYGAGSGQIEVRSASFVLVAALAIIEARRKDLLRYAVLAGFAVGFFVASKYTGLIFAFTTGLFLMFQKRWLAHGLVFSCAMFLAGCQWYGWNMWNIGDPIFPILYGKIEYLEVVPWNEAIQKSYKAVVSEKLLASNFFWYLLYPIKATLFSAPEFESLRVGFGPIILLLLPFCLFASWNKIDLIHNHPLTIFGGICLVAYTIWFFVGPSQRVRHLLPLYPLLLICIAVASLRYSQFHAKIRGAVKLVFLLVIPLHLFGATVYAVNFIRFSFSDETRDSFLRRTVSQYEAVMVANKLLSPKDTLLVSTRQIVYHINSSVYYANVSLQAVVDIHAQISYPRVLWKQLKKKNITHLLLPFELRSQDQKVGYLAITYDLKQKNCIQLMDQFEVLSITSRTLPTLGSFNSQFSLVKLTPGSCHYEFD